MKALNKDTQKVAWETTTRQIRGYPSTNLSAGPYEVEVSAVGYLTAKLEVQIQEANNLYKVDVELKKDPAAVDLIVPTEQQMPARARKAISQGVAALNSGKLKEAHKRLIAASELMPANPEVNFLLGYLFFQEKDFQQSETYLLAASTLDTHNVQALALLGRLQIQRQDYAAARRPWNKQPRLILRTGCPIAS